MPKITPGMLIALSLCGLSFSLGCGSNQHPIICNLPSSSDSSSTCTCSGSACPASFFDYVYGVGNNAEITTVPVHQIGATLGTPTTGPGPAASLGVAQVADAFLYASDPQNASGPSLDAWTIDTTTGVLTTLAGSPFALGASAHPNGLAVVQNLSSGGPFLYVADAGQIDAFVVNNGTGALTSVPGSPFPSGTNLYLAADPADPFLFAADEDTPGGVFAFAINPATGALTSVPGSPFLIGSPTQPVQTGQILVDFLGLFVYVTLPETGQVAGFSINTTTGGLTPIPGSPFAAGSGAFAMVATNNELLYVANPGGNSISGYSINQTTGALTPAASSPFTAAGVTALALDGLGDIYASGANGLAVFSVGVNDQLQEIGSVTASAATGLTVVEP